MTYSSLTDRAWVEIDLSVLGHNVRAIKQHLGGHPKLMAVVKADAYGHGAVEVAKTVLGAGATWLAIATISEGVQLRNAGITAPILILGAIRSPEEFQALVKYDLQPTIVDPAQAIALAQNLGEQYLPVHLKIDTGMGRLGTSWEKVKGLVTVVNNLPSLHLVSIYSHLATADDPDRAMMDLQHDRFQQAIASLAKEQLGPYFLHLANSAAMMRERTLHYDLVRVGLALYGYYPESFLRPTIPLQPVMAVKSRVTQIRQFPPGMGISYGHRFITQKNTKVAVVGIGYADGIPRNLSNQLNVIIHGQLAPQIGSITMDQIMVDCTALEAVEPGDIVTLIGQDGPAIITADDWAQTLDTISWEILCGFKSRLPRVYR
jgi:alanine racemase